MKEYTRLTPINPTIQTPYYFADELRWQIQTGPFRETQAVLE